MVGPGNRLQGPEDEVSEKVAEDGPSGGVAQEQHKGRECGTGKMGMAAGRHGETWGTASELARGLSEETLERVEVAQGG